MKIMKLMNILDQNNLIKIKKRKNNNWDRFRYDKQLCCDLAKK